MKVFSCASVSDGPVMEKKKRKSTCDHLLQWTDFDSTYFPKTQGAVCVFFEYITPALH